MPLKKLQYLCYVCLSFGVVKSRKSNDILRQCVRGPDVHSELLSNSGNMIIYTGTYHFRKLVQASYTIPVPRDVSEIHSAIFDKSFAGMV